MKKTLLLIWLALSSSLSLEAYQKGVVLGLYSKEKNFSYTNDIREISELGADHTSLVVSWYQKDIRSNEIYPRWEPVGDYATVSDETIRDVIRQAHQAKLKVFLFPILRIENRKNKEWRGTLDPKNEDQWLKSYRGFTLHYARLASQSGVEIFSIGSELCSMEGKTDYWQGLIAEIRQFYKGDLTYSANWDHYKKVAFWNSLDYLGLNGYHELTDHPNPTMDELLRKWWDIDNEIANWQEQVKKKILFTEIGYPSVDGACRKPWDYTREAPVDLQEQALCYEAFFLSWDKSQKLGGVYFWNWYGQGGENDRSYTPRGKPAQKVLSQWYQKDSISSSPSVSSLPVPPSPTAQRATTSLPTPAPSL